MKKALFTLAIAACLHGFAFGLEAPKHLTMPDPNLMIGEGTESMVVVNARPEDAGFQAFLKTAWEELRTSQGASGWLGLVTTFLSTSSQQNVLLTLLPIQGVRVERLDDKGQDHAATMLTVAGWPGLQSIFWNTLLNDSQGKPYPQVEVAGRTCIRRPTSLIARWQGSFFGFSDEESARRAWVDPVPEPAMLKVLQDLDRTQDTYGVILNRRGSMNRFLHWVNGGDMGAVEQGVGTERFNAAMAHIEYLSWVGDLVSDDQVNMRVKFHTDSEDSAESVASILKTARTALKQRGRAAELQLLTRREDVLVDVQIVGYRRILQAFLRAR